MPRGTVPITREFVRPMAAVVTKPSSDLKQPVLRNARKSKERAPSKQNLDRIAPGCFIKLATPDALLFWARVEEVDGECIIATVANEMPADLAEPIGTGERIALRTHHIFAIRPPRRLHD